VDERGTVDNERFETASQLFVSLDFALGIVPGSRWILDQSGVNSCEMGIELTRIDRIA
jgi:hypothetical protein